MKILILGLLLAANYAIILYRLVSEGNRLKEREKEHRKVLEEMEGKNDDEE